MGEIALYVETDGTADDPESEIARTAVGSPSLPFEEGSIVELKIEATWTDQQGHHHARVSVEKVEEPDFENENSQEFLFAHDKVIRGHKNDPLLINTPDLEHAAEELEDEFDEAVEEENGPDGKSPKNAPKPQDRYFSEGLRPPKPEPEE